MKIKPLGKNILFRFTDYVNSKGEFEQGSTASGILLQASFDESAKKPRWCEVVDVGPDCEFVKSGDVILLPALRWTAGVKVEDSKLWKTDESEVVGIKTADSIQLLHKYVVFQKEPREEQVQVGSIIIVSNIQESTPRGRVVQISGNCAPELNNSYVYFDDTNFFNDFDLYDTQLSFVKEDDVLVYLPD